MIRVRMGLHTGEAAMVGGDYMGLDIHRAARIASSAHGGQVVLSDATRTLVEGSLPDGVTLVDLGEHRLKDLARPERIWQLRIEGLPAEFPALKSLDIVPNNLPVQMTSFVGRERELAEGLRLLEANRLLTLTGPGGTGKTRLSLQIAAEASDHFKHGVFFVPLAPITDPELVATTVLEALSVQDSTGRPPQQVLVDHLRDRQALLVLDNFEQILAAAPFVGEILKASPRTKVLTSSRAALRVYGEQEFPVPPLGVPDPANFTLESLSQFEAVKLFIDRAVAVKPDFAVTNENAPAVAGIAALVDGLPLAVELAAARIKLLNPQAMLARLEGRLGELGGGARDLPERQQTLRGAIAWSYDLLEPGIQDLFSRFSVFVRGGSLDEVETVCGPGLDADVLSGMEVLVDQNLLRPMEDADEPRFFVLHVIREYALERLAEAPDARDVHARHASTFVELAERTAPLLTGADGKRWLDKLEIDHDNLRAALQWTVEQKECSMASRLLVSLWRFWQMRGHLFEGRRRAEAVLALPELQAMPRELYAVLEAAGGIAYWQGDQREADRLYNHAAEIARGFGDKKLLANALYNAAFPNTVTRENLPRSRAQFDEALALFREVGDDAGVARVLWGVAELYYLQDPPDWDGAIRLLLEAQEIFERLGDNFGLGWDLYTLGSCYAVMGENERAREALRRSLGLFARADDKSGLVLLLNQFAILAIANGDLVGAARLEGAGKALEKTSGVGLITSRTTVQPEYEATAERLPETHPEPWAEGQMMNLEHAISAALEWEPRTAPS